MSIVFNLGFLGFGETNLLYDFTGLIQGCFGRDAVGIILTADAHPRFVGQVIQFPGYCASLMMKKIGFRILVRHEPSLGLTII